MPVFLREPKTGKYGPLGNLVGKGIPDTVTKTVTRLPTRATARALADVAKTRAVTTKRRAGDSNPDGLAPGGFQDRCLTS